MRRFIVGVFGTRSKRKGEEKLRSIYGLAGALLAGVPQFETIGVSNRAEAAKAKDFKRDETSSITKYKRYESALDSFF
jgi:hypothetical protein